MKTVMQIQEVLNRAYVTTGERAKEVLAASDVMAAVREEFRRGSRFPDEVPDDVALVIDGASIVAHRYVPQGQFYVMPTQESILDPEAPNGGK